MSRRPACAKLGAMADDPSRYPILAGPLRVEETIQRSRFLTSLEPVGSADEAAAFVARLKAEFPDANHNCWAYLVGPPGSTASVGMSDDGEPHGTAGRPMLDVLVGSGLGDVAAVVTRWFGGIKLGKGGLVKAYGGCLQRALDQAPRSRRTVWVGLSLRLGYEQVAAVQRLYAAHEAELLDEAFADAVTHALRLPEERLAAFERALADATNGQVTAARDED